MKSIRHILLALVALGLSLAPITAALPQGFQRVIPIRPDGTTIDGPALGQQNSAGSTSVAPATDSPNFPVTIADGGGVLIASTETLLIASGAYTGAVFDTGGAGRYLAVGYYYTTDQAGSFYVEGSLNGTTNWRACVAASVAAGATVSTAVRCPFRYLRVRWVQGATGHVTTFSLQAVAQKAL